MGRLVPPLFIRACSIAFGPWARLSS